jgi:hypothetical protein
VVVLALLRGVSHEWCVAWCVRARVFDRACVSWDAQGGRGPAQRARADGQRRVRRRRRASHAPMHSRAP